MSYINLLPEDYLARQAQRRVNRLAGALLAVLAVGLGAAALVSETRYRHTRQVAERVSQAYADAGKLIEQEQELRATREQMLQKAAMTAGLREALLRSALLAVITNALPEGCGSLTRFELLSRRTQAVVITRASQEKGGFEPVSGPRMETTVTLTGLAGTDLEVARFIAALARCPVMETVDLVYSQEKKLTRNGDPSAEPVVVREFQVVLTLRSDADVRTSEASAPPLVAMGAAAAPRGVSEGRP